MKLLLAVDIADRLREAGSDFKSFDFETEARALLARHPEAHASVDDVIAAMQQDLCANRKQPSQALCAAI